MYESKAGAIVPQAVVNIFDLEDDYNTALGNGNTSIGYQNGLTNTTGFISLNAVKSNIENYILVTIYDTVNAIFYSNKNISSKIDVTTKRRNQTIFERKRSVRNPIIPFTC